MNQTPKTVSVIYDLRVLPPTFDFVGYLCLVEGLRSIYAPTSDGIDLTIVYGATFRGEEFLNVSSQEELIERRIYSMLLPLASLVPSVNSTSVLDIRSVSTKMSLGQVFYPNQYQPNQPILNGYYKNSMLIKIAKEVDVRVLECSAFDLNTASQITQRLCDATSPVTITIRNNANSRDRSRDNMERYIKIGESLSAEHQVILIPDTSDLGKKIETNLPICYEAAIDVRLRASIYQNAKANFFSNNGASFTSVMNKHSTYFVGDMATGNIFTREWFAKEGWFEDANPFAQGDKHQVYDFDALTLEKAMRFLRSIKN